MPSGARVVNFWLTARPPLAADGREKPAIVGFAALRLAAKRSFAMSGPIIAVTDTVFPSLDPAKAALARLNPTLLMSKSANADDILAVARDADAILVTYAKLSRELILQLRKCRAIGRFGLGVDNIDLPAAKEKGIAVNYVPDYCIREVSDHAMALLLALIRKIPLSNKLVQAGRWEMPAVVPIRRIEGTVLGLVGFGHIPRLVAPKAQAFGIKVIAFDPYAKAEAFKAGNVESVDFDTLLARADYISVHAPLTPATRGMMNATAFAKMKKGAYLVNTARGPLIDEAALVAALDAGQIGGAGLDVVAAEPLAKDSPLLGRDNVIISPHTAFYSIEALDELQSKCAGDVARVLSGEKAIYPISA
jgi:D-3-phosphoglycerate dehydrogenase